MKHLQTPCYILNYNEFYNSINGFRTALLNNFTYAIVGYSVKTNSLPYCLKEANKLGCFAEVVSNDEYELAKLCGYSINNIIYNGPMKTRTSFLEAIMGGAIVNIETKQEVDWLNDLPNNHIFNIGIRLNINISKISPQNESHPNDDSRFGFSDECSDFKNVIDVIQSKTNIKLSGLHIHRTSHTRSPFFYKDSIEYAISVIKKYKLEVEYLDLGGGFYGRFDNKPSYQDYSNIIYDTLKNHNLDKIKIIVEPGNGLVASAFSFLTEVIDTKEVEASTYFITTNGSRNDIDPFFRKSNYLKQIFLKDNTQRPILNKQIVCGCTCLENDRLFMLDDFPGLAIGDRILYNNVGAYTMCLSPLFIRYFPTIYLFKEGRHIIIRDKWTAQDYLLIKSYI